MSTRWAAILSLVVACSESPGLRVGREPEDPPSGSDGVSGAGGAGGIGSADNALTAKVTEPPGEMAIEVITIACAGECKQVLAVASGGNMPYAFAWNDGVTTAAREICTDEDTTFTVAVTDTAVVDGEFSYEAQTVSASVNATVLECADAGVVADGGETTCAADFKPGVYEGSFKQATGVLSGTHTLVLTSGATNGTQQSIDGTLDNVLDGSATMAMVTFDDGSFFDCSTLRLFLSGVRTEPGAFPLPYTYVATYDPAGESLQGTWASAAPPSPGVFPPSALDTGTWDAHWVRP